MLINTASGHLPHALMSRTSHAGTGHAADAGLGHMAGLCFLVILYTFASVCGRVERLGRTARGRQWREEATVTM